MPEISLVLASVDRLTTELSSANADIVAMQSVLVGLMSALRRNGFPESVLEEAFEFAADVTIIGSETIESTLPSDSLAVIETLKDAVFSGH